VNPLAIIPARAGSKRLPGKNREQFGGQSLTVRAMYQARAAGAAIVLSTDDDALMTECLSFPDPFWAPRRPADLAQDGTSMMAVVYHVVEEMERVHQPFDSIVLLQPTSPLRTADDIRNCVSLLQSGSEAVISVVASGLPELFTIGHAGRMRPMPLNEMADGRRVVVPNGAVFAIRRDVLAAGMDWWTASVVTAYEMPPERSVDIDTIVDLEEARRLWKLKNP
jgi:CMP-N-acetylneuraminic acid synthetase